MQTIDETREHCRLVGKDIEKMVADGEDLGARLKFFTIIHLNVTKKV